MAQNLRKGSIVSWKLGKGYTPKPIKGVVIKKYTAPKGSVNVRSNKQRTVVRVMYGNQIYLKSPSELKRI